MNNDTRSHDQTVYSGEADWALGLPDVVNATGLLAEDIEDVGLTDIQTVFLACIATIIPLFLGLLLVLGVRKMWKEFKSHESNTSGYDNDGLRREDSCDAVKSSSFMQSAEELKTSESQYSVLMPEDTCCYIAPQPMYNSPPNNRFGDTNKSNLNGSIITLTMKNNHLIVETEERVPGVYVAETVSPADNDGRNKSTDYEYDDEEFDMEAEMLRREFREASLLANGVASAGPVQPDGQPFSDGGGASAVLEPSSETQVDLTADRRPGAVQPPQHQPDLSSGGSSSADSRALENAYAYGNQSEYGGCAAASKHKAWPVKPAAVVPTTAEEEYLLEQRLLGNGVNAAAVDVEEKQLICSSNHVNGIAAAAAHSGQ